MAKQPPLGSNHPEAEYLRRSFTAVDGLWFVKVEEAYGFDRALDLDVQVWKVVGKIQAREARSILGAQSNDFDALGRCLRLKFSAENYQADLKCLDDSTLEVSITACPWLEILKNSDRLHLAERIAKKICVADLGAWAKEFGKVLKFSAINTKCADSHCCRVRFVEREET